MLRRAGAIAAACLAAILLAIPTVASAASSKYPSANAARGFDGGAAGWDSSASTEGICLAPLLCASAENSFQGSGGADGGGYIRSAYTGVIGATAVGGTTTAVWQSPPFTYTGAGGVDPGSIGFAMDRRANVDQLLAVAGNAAEYSVRLSDLSAGGEGVTLIAPTTLAGAGSWTGVSRGSIDPASLTLGDEYRIQISSRFTSGTSVLVTGSADYDNVVLSAVTGSGGGNNNGGGGGKGKGGKGGGKGSGAGSFNSQRLEELLRGATPDTAKLDAGKRLLVRVNCPRKVGRQCRTAVQGLLKKGSPATNRRSVRLRSGKSKLVALKVKPKARKQVAARKRILVRQKVRAGKATATVFKTRLLIRR
jgi:hypothetical protein